MATLLLSQYGKTMLPEYKNIAITIQWFVFARFVQAMNPLIRQLANFIQWIALEKELNYANSGRLRHLENENIGGGKYIVNLILF